MQEIYLYVYGWETGEGTDQMQEAWLDTYLLKG